MTIPRCKICSHPRRSEIDAAIVSNTGMVETANLFGVSRFALNRHRCHVIELRAKSKENKDASKSEIILANVMELEDETRDLLAKAKRANDRKMMLAAIDRLTGLLEFRAKLAGMVNPQKSSGAREKSGETEGFHGQLEGLIERARLFPVERSGGVGLYQHLVENDFGGYVRAAWPILEPATTFPR